MDNKILNGHGQDCSTHRNENCLKCCRLFKTILGTFNSSIDTQTLLKIICRELVDQYSIRANQILIFNSELSCLEHMASSGLSADYLRDSDYNLNDDFIKKFKSIELDTDSLIRDLSQKNREVYEKENIELIATSPLTRGIQVVGMMHLFGKESSSLNDCEIQLFESISGFVTGLIVNSVFNTTLKKVTETVHSSLDIEEVLKAIVVVVTKSLRVKGCSIRLLDKNQNKFHLKASSGLSEAYLNKGPVLAKRSISQVLDGKCVAIYDAAGDDRLQYPEEAVKEGIGSILSVPLMIYKNIIGDLRVYTHKPYEFSNNEINLMTAVGDQCALAIRDAQMFTHVKEKYENLISDFHQWYDK